MFNKILENIDVIEKNKEYILNEWMKYEIVQNTLKHHEIGIDFYREKFGSKVFDYAMGVVKNSNKLGQCPVIGVMLMLFKKKNIPLSDIFIICVHLKNAFMCFASDNKILDKELISEVSELMDYNFKGVIDEYVAMYYNRKFVPKSCLKPEKENPKNTNQPNTIASSNEQLHQNTTSATKYLEEVEYDHEAVSELSELEDDALNAIDAQPLIAQEALDESAILFSKYAKVLNTLYEFEELSYTLTILSDLLNNSDFNAMDDYIQSYIQIYLKAIISDLQSWRMSIFITHEAEDVHYLDKTLLSSISQLQITLMPQNNTSTDEIEFF